MAIRIRSGSRKKRYEVYWNNPFTGKRQSLYFSTEPEAEKEDALIKYRLKRMSGIHLAIPVFSKGYRLKQGKVVP